MLGLRAPCSSWKAIMSLQCGLINIWMSWMGSWMGSWVTQARKQCKDLPHYTWVHFHNLSLKVHGTGNLKVVFVQYYSVWTWPHSSALSQRSCFPKSILFSSQKPQCVLLRPSNTGMPNMVSWFFFFTLVISTLLLYNSSQWPGGLDLHDGGAAFPGVRPVHLSVPPLNV